MTEAVSFEDPYKVYTLRRPAERASTIVPQLPKQPEFTDTRLRYKRIARSGSLQDLSYLPATFHFPPRVSGLDTLSEDDASVVVRVKDGRVVRAPSAWGIRGEFVLMVERPGGRRFGGRDRVKNRVKDRDGKEKEKEKEERKWLKRFVNGLKFRRRSV